MLGFGGGLHCLRALVLGLELLSKHCIHNSSYSGVT